MKNIKKIVTLCSALLLTLGLAGFASCAELDVPSSTPENSESVSAPESSAPESSEDGGETPDEPDEPEIPERKLQFNEVGYFTETVFPREYTSFSHELDAGIYYVMSYVENTVFNDLSEGVFAELTEKGEIEFDVYYNDWEADLEKEVEVEYFIYELFPLEMQETEVTASFLASGAITPVNVTLPEAGIYRFTVNQDVSFFATINANEFLAYQSYYTLVAEEANTEITLYIGGLESAYGNVELTLGLEKVAPAAVTQETQTLSLTVAGDNAFAFTAEENGAYRIDFDENLAVAAFNDETNTIAYAFASDYFEFDYAGEPVVFFARYAGIAEEFVSPYGASVTITRIGDEGYRSPVAPETLYLTPEFPQESVVPANSVAQDIPLTVIISPIGDWSISWDNEKVKVYVGETLIENDYEFSIIDNRASLTLTVHNETATNQPVTFTLTEKYSGSGGNTLTLGANSVTVTVTNYYANQTECTFTAEKAGKYRISAADGEENAEVYDANNEWIEELPYEFELQANESTTFFVASAEVMTITTDEINLVIEYFDEATQSWVQA